MIRLLVFSLILLSAASLRAAERPNVVWIVSEDNSIHYLDHYFPGGADTPNIKALAKTGLTFDHAFSNAPVCSVARTTLATMCLGPRVGTQWHRRFSPAQLPQGQGSFYEAVRAEGYYTTNQKKTDFNFISGQGGKHFDKGSWRDRPKKEQPFFHMQSHTNSHESSLHFNEQSYQSQKTKHDPAKVTLADYHPDTPLFRYTHARYLDNIQTIDGIVGNTVGKLKEDGLLDDTFIFYFGDHGGVLPRGKGYAYESGLHVPLVIHVPKNFRHLVKGAEIGARVENFVSFIDFGPTVLELIGAEQPKGIDGRPFLGKDIDLSNQPGRDRVFGYADRMDEKYDFVRTLRVGKFQYMRNFQPHYADGQQNNYRYRMLAYQEWRELHQAGKLNEAQSQFFESRPPELLYDCEADPHQVKNLAGDPAHAETLATLRAELKKKCLEINDLSFFPESQITQHAMKNPVAFGEEHKKLIAEVSDIADLALLPFDEAKPKLLAAYASEEPLHQYWAAMSSLAFRAEEGAKVLAPAAEKVLESEFAPARVRAAEFLGEIGHLNPQPPLARVANGTSNPVEAAEALQAIIHFNDKPDGKGRYVADPDKLDPKAVNDGVSRRMGYLYGNPDGWKKKKKGK